MGVENIPLMSGRGFAGHLRDFQRERLQMLTRAQREGDVVRAQVFGRNFVMVNHPDIAHEILVEHARSFEKSPGLRLLLFLLAGDGLFTSEGELWRTQRKLMAPLFQPAQIGAYGEIMRACTVRAIDRWAGSSTIDVDREMTRITMAVVGKALFDSDTFDEADELGDALTTGLEWAGRRSGAPGMVAQIMMYEVLDNLSGRGPAWLRRAVAAAQTLNRRPFAIQGAYSTQMRQAVERLDRKIQDMIDERRSGHHGRRDLLSRLLAARDDEDPSAVMTDRQVRDEATTLFIAGHETTATALTWAFYELGRKPALMRRVVAEVDALDHDPGFEDASRIPLTLRVFKESMRLYPPVVVLPRRAIEPVTIGGHEFRKGTIAFVSVYGIHRRPDLWPDPETFDPDRFLPEAEASRPRCAYLPFGAGPRVCIGNHFALLEGPIVLATILRHFDVRVDPTTKIAPGTAATLRPGRPVVAAIRRREANSSTGLRAN